MNDDVYPNDGSYYLPREPKDQRIGRKKEQAKALEKQDILSELIQRLDNRISFYASVDSIPADVKADPEAFLIMHNANEQTRNNLSDEREYIVSLLDTHAPLR